MPEARPPIFCFGPFEFDAATGRLHKFGHRVKLQGNPIKVLEALLEAEGEMVTREQMQARIWPVDTFVDFEHGLNAAVAKLRQALSDSAAAPRYVETVERRGYRFICAVERKPRAQAAAAGGEVSGSGMPAGSPAVPFMTGGPPVGAPPVAVTSGSEAPVAGPGRLSRGRRAWAGIGLTLILAGAAALAAYLYFRAGTRSRDVGEIRSIAVLPFKDLSRDATPTTLADGMTDGLTTALAQVGSLRVISATSAMSYRGTSKRLPEIAAELRVDGIIEGTVMRSGDRLRVAVQLIDGRSDAHLWANEYEREQKDILMVQREVARAVVKELRILLSADQERRFAFAKAVAPAAHEAYVKGRSHWYRRWLGGVNDLETSGEYFRQAVQLDPTFAPAYSGLADYYAFLAIYGHRRPSEVWPEAEKAIARALELDSSLAEAHVSLAVSRLYWHRDYEGADQASLRALQLNPNYSEAHSFRSTLLAVMGRFDDSIAAARQAEDLDPVGQLGRHLLALARAHRYEELERGARLLLEKHPGLAYGFLSSGYHAQGRFQEAFEMRMKSLEISKDVQRISVYREAYRAGGYPAIWRWELETMKARAREQYVSPFQLAGAYARAGDREAAFRELQRSLDEHSDLLVFLQVDQSFDNLHGDPRFAKVLQQVGISNFPAPQ